jgi:hypothetical protein
MKKRKLWLVDCIKGHRFEIEKDSFVVRDSSDDSGQFCFEVIPTNEGYTIEGDLGRLYYDGQESAVALVQDEGDHTLIVEGRPYVLRVDKEKAGKEWCSAVDPSKWYVYKRGSSKWLGPVILDEVPMMVSREPGEFIIMCHGMSEMGFYAHQVLDTIEKITGVTQQITVSDTVTSNSNSPELEEAKIDIEYGEFTCPVCWFRFDRGDVMNIAVHADLLGDPILGEDKMLRFHATRFNDRNQAVDSMGISAPDSACPHCRRRLPPGFLDQKHHIFSIVGAPSSGKSYYLSVLIKVLQGVLFRKFALAFRDASPEDNAVLNDMRNHLFSASKPEDAYLSKTQLEGDLYEEFPRQGRMVKLPKPFTFLVSSQKVPDDDFSIVFYDNAGEHFEPGSNSADSPGAQHISVASGVFFLLDPLYNADFRGRIKASKDPQLQQQRNDQQDIILSESEVRIKQILGLATAERIATPMAIIVGKSDAWIEMLGPEPLMPLLDEQGEEAIILMSNIKSNSDRVRNLLMDVCPAIVANAEAISSNVCYFAASPLGHPPIKFNDVGGAERIGPDPQKLDPQRVEDATLWVLSQLAPNIFPSDQPN